MEFSDGRTTTRRKDFGAGRPGEIAGMIAQQLQEAGFAITLVRDCEAAIAALEGEEFSLALLDIMPPRPMDRSARHIRESGKNTAVIMMTPTAKKFGRGYVKAGIVDYLSKPFAADDMLQRVMLAIANRRVLLEKQRLEQEKNDFVSMLSHDMKNPLTA